MRTLEEETLLRQWICLRRDFMKTPEDVTVMLRLKQLGWGTKRIARELGISRNTVRGYLRKGEWRAYGNPQRAKTLDGLEDWLEDRFFRHAGNADVIRQELQREKGIDVSLRTVERAVRPYRDKLKAEQKATVRFETPPGHQLQCDFGQTRVMIGGEKVKVHLCVMTLGFSRRICVVAHAWERQHNWLTSFERSFEWFGGRPVELLVDNARALVSKHDVVTREVLFNPTFAAFCRHWDVTPRACAPYRARTKGKDERAVGYVKRNAIAGRPFRDWDHLQTHLDEWCQTIADIRIHGTTGERPIDRFEASEAAALRPLEGRIAFQRPREVVRKVGTDFCVEVDTNRYSVPYRFIGQRVSVLLDQGQVEIRLSGEIIATHPVCRGRREWVVAPKHLEGVVTGPSAWGPTDDAPIEEEAVNDGELLRPLSEYEAVVGGAW